MFFELRHLTETEGWRMIFNIFRYVSFRAAGAAVTSFLITLIVLPKLINKLRSGGVTENTGNIDSAKLTEIHSSKSGTPTMGGLGIIAGILGAALLWTDLTSPKVLITLFTMLTLGALGAVDDWTKLTVKDSKGLRARTKFGIQIVIAIIASSALVYFDTGPFASTKLAIPFIKSDIFAPDLGMFYIALAVLIIVGTSNAVNLTDGLDGLAAGCTSTAAFAYAGLTYLAGHSTLAAYLNVPYIRGAGEITIITAALFGAALGFLWYNTHPAEIFMGDTGSLAIGGVLAMSAAIAKQELLLVLVGAVFVMEAGSVILQVGSFKLTGKRIFRITPIHHHFEFKGWSENKIVVRFWVLSVVAALLSIATLKVR